MRLNRIVPVVGLLGLGAVATAAPPVFTGPTPYQSIADSPYFADGQTCYALETFPDGVQSESGFQFNSQTGAEIVPGVGVPPGGHVLQANPLGVIQLSFDPPVNEVGFVWTGGDPNGSTITLTVIAGTEAISEQYSNLPSNDPNNPDDNQFFGVSWDVGVQQVRITLLPFGPGIPNQIDDIQFNTAAQPLGAPVAISPIGGSAPSSPTFDWAADPCATWYQLWVNDSTGTRLNKWYTAAQVGASSGQCSITPTLSLEAGAATWWIRSWNAEYGNGPWNSGSSFVVDGGFGPPTLIAPSGSTSTNYPLFTWQPVSTATWYQLWVNDSSGTRINQWFTAAQVQASSGICRIAPGVALATGNCTWWVRSWNENDGSSEWSPGKSFQTAVWGAPVPAEPTGASVSSPTYRWQPVAGATWYQLWVEDSSGVRISTWFTAGDVNAASGQCSIAPEVVLSSGDCTWWVRPWNQSRGNGPWSPGSSFSVP